jgi:NAD(P)-dependent dehydrogenase (short-subunit alcohol dehydrogenase family)
MELSPGKVAVVTGAGSGIGRALAERFARSGLNIVLADVQADALKKAADDVATLGVETTAVPTDVTVEADVQALAAAALDRFGAVHVVCNNAGVESGALFSDIPLQTWEWVVNVNFWGVLNGCRVFLPLLREQGDGHIVNTASVASFSTGLPTFAPYCVTKFAVLALSECLEIELRTGAEKIGVSLLAPGVVATQMPNAERNRPEGVPGTRDNPLRREILEMLETAAATVGMAPSEVATQVVDAIREQRFFVLTHPDDALEGMRRRLRWMELGEAPAIRGPSVGTASQA